MIHLSTSYEFINIHIHQFKHKRKSSSRFIAQKISLGKTFKFYKRTSCSFTMFECGFKRFNAWISRKLFTWSMLWKWFFMHLIATYCPFFTDCALQIVNVQITSAKRVTFNTSENVPSPFLEMRRYSHKKSKIGEWNN